MGAQCGELGASTAEHPQPEEKGQRMLGRERCLRGVTSSEEDKGRSQEVGMLWEEAWRRLEGGDMERQRQVEPPAPC